MEDYIIKEFYEGMKDVDFNAYGIIDSSDKIHTLGTDSKIIGRIFEMYTEPVLSEIAKRHGMIIVTPEKQNYYPDFIMMVEGKPETKIAIDVKTSYVATDNSSFRFTLGAFGSYMRDNQKNIMGKYTDYIKHYAICFIYKRNGLAQKSDVVDYSERETIQCPFYDVKYCIQEKYKIAGDTPGSGNTENIGSFSTNNILELKNGNGPFKDLGEDIYELYWKYYPRYTNPNKHYTSIEQFATWFIEQEEIDVQLLHDYNYEATKQRIMAYIEKLKK